MDYRFFFFAAFLTFFAMVTSFIAKHVFILARAIRWNFYILSVDLSGNELGCILAKKRNVKPLKETSVLRAAKVQDAAKIIS